MSGIVRLWHPAGVEVELPVADGVDYKKLYDAVGAALAAGFAAAKAEPGEGEGREAVGYVLRKTKDSRSGGVSDQIDLYATNDAVKFPVLTVYLNDDAERSAFESFSGLRLASLPEYAGNDKVERGKAAKTDRFIVKSAKPFAVVYAPNPKWKQADHDAAVAAQKMYPVPRRKFVRWEGGA